MQCDCDTHALSLEKTIKIIPIGNEYSYKIYNIRLQ